MRWPKGDVCCIACGSVKVSRITREKAGKNKRNRIYQCLEPECKHQFSATAGTIFHDSHLPLDKWFLAIALICEAKKGISANQLKRHLGVNYRTAWHLAHRIREAMKEGDFQLTGHVEADETYIGPKVHRKGNPRPKRTQKDVVLGMVERGGRLRLIPVADSKRTILQPVIEKHVSPDVTTIYTDEHPIYEYGLKDRFDGKHRTINHRRSYGIGDTHTNTIENAFSLFKRGLIGSYHKVSIKHLARYCNEFSYRFNRRDEQLAMFGETLKNLLHGEALPYKRLTASQVSAS
jgi:transposase-like protein